MAKGAQERIDDTLAAIRAAPQFDLIIRGHIAAFVDFQFPRATPQQRQTFRTLSQQMSVKNHVGPGVPAGNTAQRELRRAIFLLWSAIGQAQQCGPMAQAAAAMTLQPAQLAAAFDEAMRKAAVVASLAGSAAVFGELCLHPVRFLRQNKLVINGVVTGAPRFSAGAPLGGGYQNVLNFEFQYDAANDRFQIQAAAVAQFGLSHTLAAVSVPAVHWTQVPGVGALPPHAFTGILGCELAGANFMLTTQFTGCAFNWTVHGGVIRASHLSPAGGGVGAYPGGGIALAQAVAAGGQMANAGQTACTVFGAGAGNAPPPHPPGVLPQGAGASFYPNRLVDTFNWATIIGVLKGGQWRLYHQLVGANDTVTDARRIM